MNTPKLPILIDQSIPLSIESEKEYIYVGVGGTDRERLKVKTETSTRLVYTGLSESYANYYVYPETRSGGTWVHPFPEDRRYNELPWDVP